MENVQLLSKGFLPSCEQNGTLKCRLQVVLVPFYEWQNTNKTIHGNFPLFLDLATCAHDFKIGVQIFKLNGVMHLAMYNVWLSENSVFKNRFFCAL